MLQNISCLTQACDKLKLSYEFFDREKNFVRVKLGSKWQYFQLNKTPFNSEVVYSICRDKMHSYQLFSPIVNMPTTLSFLDWHIDTAYRQYLEYNGESDIIRQVEQTLEYPVIVKKNQGALGENVHLCENKVQLGGALQQIFNRASKEYDYIALAQQYIPTKHEYRLVCTFGEPVLTYKRGNGGEFNKKYWEKGESAVLVTDPELIAELFDFVKAVFDHLDIGFAGFDIIRRQDDTLYLIEVNSSPRFEHFVQSSGSQLVVDLYEKALNYYLQNH